MKVIKLISISLLSLGIFGDNSSWGMEFNGNRNGETSETLKGNVIRNIEPKSLMNKKNKNEIIENEEKINEYPNRVEPVAMLDIMEGFVKNPEINEIEPRNEEAIDESKNMSLAKKIKYTGLVNSIVQNTTAYRNINEEIKKWSSGIAAELVRTIRDELDKQFASSKYKDNYIKQIFIELGYRFAKEQVGDGGFCQGEIVDISDNLQ